MCVYYGPCLWTKVAYVCRAFFALLFIARFRTDAEIAAMLKESDAGLSESEYEDERDFSPLVSEDEKTSDSRDEPKPEISSPPTKKEVLSLPQFKQYIAETMIKGNPTRNSKRMNDTSTTCNSIALFSYRILTNVMTAMTISQSLTT